MYKIRELIDAIGKSIVVPDICPVQPDVTVDEDGYCERCGETHLIDVSLEEVKNRIELLFLLHQPAGEGDRKLCASCGQEFPCSTLTALDGVPEEETAEGV